MKPDGAAGCVCSIVLRNVFVAVNGCFLLTWSTPMLRFGALIYIGLIPQAEGSGRATSPNDILCTK